MSAVETKQQSDSVRKHKEFLFPAVATYYQEPLALIKGEGFHVWDDKGDKYLDCFGGVLTVSSTRNTRLRPLRFVAATNVRPFES